MIYVLTHFFFNFSLTEIESSVCVNEDDSSIVKQLKETISQNIKKRFPIHETHVCAFLDSTLQNIRGVVEYLTDKQQSPEEFLIYMIHKMVPLNTNNEQVRLFLYFNS